MCAKALETLAPPKGVFINMFSWWPIRLMYKVMVTKRLPDLTQ